MQEFNLLEILKLGLPGLVFLLAWFSYQLLSKEQQKDVPSEPVLETIRFYMYVCLLLATMTLLAPIAGSLFRDRLETYAVDARVDQQIGDGPNLVAGVCHDARYANRYLLVRDNETFGLVQVFASRILPCSDGEEQLVLSEDARTKLKWAAEQSEGRVDVASAPAGLQFVLSVAEKP